MTIFDSLLLGIIQGITEFLPISSSGHLVIFEKILGLDVSNLKTFDIAVHLGTLFAILVYFRRDFWRLITIFFVGAHCNAPLQRKSNNTNKYRKLWFFLIIGTIPAVIIGLFFENQIDEVFRSKFSVAIMMIIVGILFLIVEYLNKNTAKESVELIKKSSNQNIVSKIVNGGLRVLKIVFWQGGKRFARRRTNAYVDEEIAQPTQPKPIFQHSPKDIKTWKQSLIIGVAQAFALIPGVSRSGSTIAAGVMQGINREKAARFSFLLGSIAIFGAALLTFLQVLKSGEILVGFLELFIGFAAAAFSGFLSVAFLMKFLKKHSLNVFGIYLVLIGGLICVI